MPFGRRILTGQEFETYKDRIDTVETIDDLARVVASVKDPVDREKILQPALRRLELMLTRRVDEYLKSN